MRFSGVFAVVAACIVGFAHGSPSTAFSDKQNDTPLLPVAVNTWPFTNATAQAWKVLSAGGSSLDAIEQGCSECESERCDGSVGWGGSPNEDGETTLDAMIMDGTAMSVGSVGCLRRVKTAISVARKVMETTFHTLLVGEDATHFAVENGFKEESLASVESAQIWSDWMKNGKLPNYRKTSDVAANALHERIGHDTIGMVAIDVHGNISCGTTTNGASHKVPGRVGDSPITGAGSFCDTDVGGAAATGDGDVMMRFLPSHSAVMYMKSGLSPQEACQQSMKPIIDKYPNFSGGLICINKKGEVGAAAAGFGGFAYSLRNPTVDHVQVISVPKFN